MNSNDFRYVYRGTPVRPLLKEEAGLLQAINKRGKGKKQALLMLHGFSSSPAVFRKLVDQLPAYDAVVSPILPGHATSIDAFSKVKASEWLGCAKQYCAALTQEYQQIDVLGLSLGGLIACHLSQEFKLNHLFLLAPALSLRLNTASILLLAQTLHRLGFQYIRNRAGNLCNKNESELAYRLLPIATIIELFNLVNDHNLIIPSCPTDLFLGKYDQVVNSDALAHRFKDQKHIKIHWLNHSAHLLPLDNDLPYLVRCLEHYFQNLRKTSR